MSFGLEHAQAPAEVKIIVLGVLLNLPWELLQMPLYASVPATPAWQAIAICTRAALGDAVILLIAFWVVALGAGSRRWTETSTARQVTMFLLIGVSITVVIETLALTGRWVDQWQYSPAMPIVPGTVIGLSPVLQWLVLPALLLWMLRRQRPARRH